MTSHDDVTSPYRTRKRYNYRKREIWELFDLSISKLHTILNDKLKLEGSIARWVRRLLNKERMRIPSCTAWRISSIMASPNCVGLPGLLSSSIDSRPSRNILCHFNTIKMETCTPSTAVSIICLVSVCYFSRLTQNLITSRRSKLWFLLQF